MIYNSRADGLTHVVEIDESEGVICRLVGEEDEEEEDIAEV